VNVDADTLRQLEAYALRGGAPAAFVGELMHELVTLALDVEELRRDARGAQRLKALQDARAQRLFLETCRRYGYTPAEAIAAACARYRVSRATLYRRRSAVAEK
jgi:hypothetical protein